MSCCMRSPSCAPIITFLSVQSMSITICSLRQPSGADHCARICAELEVQFAIKRIRVAGIADEGLEAAARRARYAALVAALGPEDILLTAHHGDDQAETVLLQLLRGAGVAGLAAIPMQTRFRCRPDRAAPCSVFRVLRCMSMRRNISFRGLKTPPIRNRICGATFCAPKSCHASPVTGRRACQHAGAYGSPCRRRHGTARRGGRSQTLPSVGMP